MTAWKDMFIEPNKFSRPATKLTSVRKVVLHYTANNGGTAMNHYNYFNSLKDRYASAHLFVDKIEALCIIPLNEIAFHANDNQKYVNGVPYRGVQELKPNANLLSIGVEMCMEKDGSIHPDTIKRTEDVVAELCKKFNLDPINDIVRHFDVTAKSCPAPWVKNGQLFIDFKNRVKDKLNTKVTTASTKPITQPNYTLTSVFYNNNKITALLENGVTYVQLRELSDLLEIPLAYNEQSKTVTFNGRIVNPLIIEGRSYMKVREIAEELGKLVVWDGKSVHISDK